MNLSETDNGTRIGAHVGDRLQVVLASTYWTFGAASNPAVLRFDAPATVVPRTSGCVPGQGCGTVTAAFTALSKGSAAIVATRTSCGEAVRCTGTSGTYRVDVIVS